MSHVLALVTLLDGNICQTQVLAEGTEDECIAFAEQYADCPPPMRDDAIKAQLTVREIAEWNQTIAHCEAISHVSKGGKLS